MFIRRRDRDGWAVSRKTVALRVNATRMGCVHTDESTGMRRPEV